MCLVWIKTKSSTETKSNTKSHDTKEENTWNILESKTSPGTAENSENITNEEVNNLCIQTDLLFKGIQI